MRFLRSSLFVLLPLASISLVAAPQAQIPSVELDNKYYTEPSDGYGGGDLIEGGVNAVLAQLHAEKKLKGEAFTKQSCMNAKNIGSKGGYQTRQLFLLTSTCKPHETLQYIIKEPATDHEIDALKAIAAYEPLKPFIAPNKRKNFPILALPIAYFSYPAEGKTHYIEIMPRAKGESMFDLVAKFRDNQTPANLVKIKAMFRNFGKQRSLFHRRFMVTPEEAAKHEDEMHNKIIRNTITHQDLHYNNAFYDEKTGELWFIDLESMNNSLHHPTSPWKDLTEPFWLQFTTNFPNFAGLIKGINVDTWIDISLKEDMEGYLESYTPAERVQAIEELRKMYMDLSILGWGEWDQKQLPDLKKKVNAVFDQLKKQNTH